MILYTFLHDPVNKTHKGDGGNILFEEMVKFINETKDKELLNDIYGEIKLWLLIGRSSYFVMAVNLVAALNIIEYKSELESIRIKIIKRQIADFPDYLINFIDNALRKLN